VQSRHAEPVLKAEKGCFDTILLVNDVANPCILDEFLTAQDSAEQQPDDHEHNRDLDQCEAGLPGEGSSARKATAR